MIYREGYKVDVGKYLHDAWQLLSKNLGLFIGYTAVYLAIDIALNYIPILGALAMIIITGPLIAGFYLASFKVLRNETLDFKDFFQGFNQLVPLVILNVVIGIFVSLGIILLIIPGIYLAVSYTFAMVLVVDKQLDFWSAMEYSRKVVAKNFFGVLGLVLVLGLINFAGALAFGIGILVTIPLTAIIITAAYKDIFMAE